MRRRLTLCLLGFGPLLWLLIGDTAVWQAEADERPTRPVTPSIVALEAAAEPATPIRAVSLTDTRDRVADAEVALQLATLQKQNDDRSLQEAQAGMEEIRQEARDIADTTVRSAVNTYRHNELDVGLLELTDLNAGLRANALGDAALVADTEVFKSFYAKQKDLEIAQAELAVRAGVNRELSSRVVELQQVLEAEQSWLAELEETNIQQLARRDSVKASTWAQNRGRKQGFYLLTCPVAGQHSFIDSWGFARSGGRRHKGVDILASTGTPVVAPVSGVVGAPIEQGRRAFVPSPRPVRQLLLRHPHVGLRQVRAGQRRRGDRLRGKTTATRPAFRTSISRFTPAAGAIRSIHTSTPLPSAPAPTDGSVDRSMRDVSPSGETRGPSEAKDAQAPMEC